MDRYTHSSLSGEPDALAKLPDLSTPTAFEAVATGTDGKSVLSSCLSSQGGESEIVREELRGMSDYYSVNRVSPCCPCEERSDEAISSP